MNRRNVILSDCATPADFVKGVEDSTAAEWEVIEHRHRYDRSRLRNILSTFRFTFTFLLRHRRVGRILAWQQRFGVMIAFFNRYIYRRRKLDICIMTFIYNSKPGLKGRLYRWLVEKSITSRCVGSVVVFSHSEVEHYKSIFPAAAHKFRFAQLGLENGYRDYYDESIASQDYIFTAGTSRRDYDFIYRVFDGFDCNLKAASPDLNEPLSSNVEALRACRGTNMLRYLYNCRAVVVPLKEGPVSAGQLFMLNAMQFGKPIIVTDIPSIHTYVEDGVSALIVRNDVEAWRSAVNRLLSDADLYAKLSEAGVHKGREQFTSYNMGRSVGCAMTQSEEAQK